MPHLTLYKLLLGVLISYRENKIFFQSIFNCTNSIHWLKLINKQRGEYLKQGLKQ